MTRAGRLVILIGPKGCGKSYIGRLLEVELSVRFFHVEPLWMRYHETCRTEGCDPSIEEGIANVHPVIRAALNESDVVCIETTGASRLILQDLMRLGGKRPFLAWRRPHSHRVHPGGVVRIATTSCFGISPLFSIEAPATSSQLLSSG